jgi:hypothetical protein
MSRWKSGDILALAAGLVLLSGALMPWIVAEGAAAARYASAAGREGLLAFTLVAAVSLLVTGSLRTSWTALAALFAAFVATFVGFTAAIPAHAQGVHPGFGLFAIAAGAALALVACVLNAIEREGRSL